MGLVRGPGVAGSVSWNARVEFVLAEIAANTASANSGGSSPAIVSLLQQIAGDLADVEALIQSAPQGERPIVRSSRQLHNCAPLEISLGTPLVIGADPDRLKIRICNNSGDGSGGYPIIDPCFIVLGFGGLAPTAEGWDQIILPGEAALVDAPGLAVTIAVLKSEAPVIGVFTVTQYFATP